MGGSLEPGAGDLGMEWPGDGKGELEVTEQNCFHEDSQRNHEQSQWAAGLIPLSLGLKSQEGIPGKAFTQPATSLSQQRDFQLSPQARMPGLTLSS